MKELKEMKELRPAADGVIKGNFKSLRHFLNLSSSVTFPLMSKRFFFSAFIATLTLITVLNIINVPERPNYLVSCH